MREDYVIFEYKDSDFEALSLKEQWNQSDCFHFLLYIQKKVENSSLVLKDQPYKKKSTSEKKQEKLQFEITRQRKSFLKPRLT